MAKYVFVVSEEAKVPGLTVFKDSEHSSEERVNRSSGDHEHEIEVIKKVKVSMEPRATCIKRNGLCLSKQAFTEEELLLIMKPDSTLSIVSSVALIALASLL